MSNNRDRYGATETTTEYEGQERPGSRKGLSLSVWAIVGLSVFLAAIFIWVWLQPPGGTDPAPGGSAGTGIVREPGPSTNTP